MIFKIRNKTREPVKVAEAPKEKTDGVYTALLECLDDMEKNGHNRINLIAYETIPDKNAFGNFNSDFPYYPFETLTENEQKMILDKKNYKVGSLVLSQIPSVVKYEDSGFESCSRTHIYPFLSKPPEESILNYNTSGGVYYKGESLKKYSEELGKCGWTSQDVKEKYEEGKLEYNKVTKRLLHNHKGLQNSLENMEQRGYSPLEKIFCDMRTNIINSKMLKKLEGGK